MAKPGFPFTDLLGVIDIIASIYYLCMTVGNNKKGKTLSAPTNSLLKLWELFICPIALFLSGAILYLNGWRLDPLLQFQQLLFHLIAGVALFKQTRKLARDR